MATTMMSPQTIDIQNTFGASLIGALISAILYGLTSLQTYIYFVTCTKDSRGLKWFVFCIWVLETAHVVIMSIAIYHYLVINYFNPAGLIDGHWSLFTSIAMNSLLASAVQSFFVIRIHRLCDERIRWWVTSVLSIAVLGHFAFGIETAVFMFIKKQLSKISETNLIAATPFAIFAVLSDTLIAGSLCYLLYGRRTGFRRTNAIVHTLMVCAVKRCVLTSIVAIAEIITFTVMPHSLWFIAAEFIIGRLYANSLLAALNSRSYVSNVGGEDITSIHLSNIQFNKTTVDERDTKLECA